MSSGRSLKNMVQSFKMKIRGTKNKLNSNVKKQQPVVRKRKRNILSRTKLNLQTPKRKVRRFFKKREIKKALKKNTRGVYSRRGKVEVTIP